MRHRTASPLLQWQPRLRAIQRLNLALFIQISLKFTRLNSFGVGIMPPLRSKLPTPAKSLRHTTHTIPATHTTGAARVLVQPEMEKRRSPLVSIPPFGRGFSRHGVFRPDGGWAAQEGALTPPFIVSMSPPGYPSAWLRPRSARFRFARQNHCNSATSCRFSTSGLPVTPPEPRPARPES
jgi:hypothetical protein